MVGRGSIHPAHKLTISLADVLKSPATPRGSFARKTLGTASEHRPHLEDLERHRGPSQKQLRVNRDLVSSNTVTG